MGLSTWTDIAKLQQATCDHSGTTTVTDSVASCSDCGQSWPTDSAPPVQTLTRQVAL